MTTINFNGATVDGETISTSDLENTYANLYDASPTFKKVIDYILRHHQNPEILVTVVDTLSTSNSSHVVRSKGSE